MARRTTTDPQPGMAAAYPGDCPRCPAGIKAGDRIVFQRGVALHVSCATGQDDQ